MLNTAVIELLPPEIEATKEPPAWSARYALTPGEW